MLNDHLEKMLDITKIKERLREECRNKYSAYKDVRGGEIENLHIKRIRNFRRKLANLYIEDLLTELLIDCNKVKKNKKQKTNINSHNLFLDHTH